MCAWAGRASTGNALRICVPLGRFTRRGTTDSLDKLVPGKYGHEETLHDMVADPNAPDPADVVIVGDTARKVIEAMGCLTPLELDVIRLRYGFERGLTRSGPRWFKNSNSYAMITRMVAEKLGVSVQNVRFAQARALAKLRAWPDDPPSMQRSGKPGKPRVFSYRHLPTYDRVAVVKCL